MGTGLWSAIGILSAIIHRHETGRGCIVDSSLYETAVTWVANQAAMVAGKRINDRLFVRYVFGSQGEPGSFRIRYQLGRGFSLEASTGSRQSLDLIYMLER